MGAGLATNASRAKNSRCGQKDDGFNACLEKMLQADAIILGSPTYFTDVSAEMKALLDRAGLVAVANGGLFRQEDRGCGGCGETRGRHARL